MKIQSKSDTIQTGKFYGKKMFERIKALFKNTRKDIELELLYETENDRTWAELYLVYLYGTGEDTTEYNREYIKHVLIDTEDIQQEQAKVDILLSEEDRIDNYNEMIAGIYC